MPPAMSDNLPPAKRVKITSEPDNRFYNSLPSFDLTELYIPEIVSIRVIPELDHDDDDDDDDDEETLTFTVPRELLCANSAYFTGIFKGGFVESETRFTEVRDTDFDIFACFINFLYTRRIVSAYGWQCNNSHERLDHASTWSFSILFALYIFADKYDSKGFRDAVFEKIQLKTLTRSPGLPNITTMCQNLLSASPLYRLTVDLRLRCHHDENDLHEYPAEFLAECLVLSRRRLEAISCQICGWRGTMLVCDSTTHSRQDVEDQWGEGSWCQFHEHSDGREKRVCELLHQTNDILADDEARRGGEDT